MRSRLEKDFTVPEDNEEDTVPDSYQRSDEVAASSLAEERDERYHTPERTQSRHGRPTRIARPSYGSQRRSYRHSYDQNTIRRQLNLGHGEGVEEEYTYPENHGGLDEPAAPPPIESRPSHPYDSLEQRFSHSQQIDSLKRRDTPKETFQEDEERNLTELTCPAPVEQLSARYASRKLSVPADPSSSADGPENKQPPPPHAKATRLAAEAYTVSYLILFSILGTLARLGLQALTFYPGAPVQTGVLWCNFTGSLVMGFLAEDRKLFREDFELSEARKHSSTKHDAEKARPNKSDLEVQPFISAAQKQAMTKAQASVKRTIPLYIGLSTGFCGSFTSFSSFTRDGYLALSNALPVPVSHTSAAPINAASTVHRNGGYGFLAICAVIIPTVVLCIGALVAGAHLALALEPLTPHVPSFYARRFVDRLIVLLAWSAWLGAIILAIWPPDRPSGPIGQASWALEHWRGDALFALVFAPVGCLLRFYTSLHLNGKMSSFPLGTFAVNIFGTALEGMFYDLQHVPLGGRIGCQVLQGLMDGFCGCLTTVSTWVAELKGLRLRQAYTYGAASVAAGVGLVVVIMGSLQWTRGFRSPLCEH